jgi:hypothetical protein
MAEAQPAVKQALAWRGGHTPLPPEMANFDRLSLRELKRDRLQRLLDKKIEPAGYFREEGLGVRAHNILKYRLDYWTEQLAGGRTVVKEDFEFHLREEGE